MQSGARSSNKAPAALFSNALLPWFQEQRGPWVTLFVVAANVVVFIGMVLFGQIPLFGNLDVLSGIKLGGQFPPLTFGGQPWRLITCMFQQGNLVHLLSNMVCLFFVGRLCERLYGHWKYLVLYLISGIGGALFSYPFSLVFADLFDKLNLLPEGYRMIDTVGASGAICGIIAAYLVGFFVHRKEIPPDISKQLTKEIFGVATLYVFFSATVKADNGSHLGGLIFGATLGFFLLPRNNNFSFGRTEAIASALALLVATCLFTLETLQIGDASERLVIGKASYAATQQDDKQAIADLQALLSRKPDNKLAFKRLIEICYSNHPELVLHLLASKHQKNTMDAEEFAAEAHAYAVLGQYQKAVQDSNVAVKLRPTDPHLKALQSQLRITERWRAGDFSAVMRYAKGDYTEASVSDQKAYHAICYAIAARRCKAKDANELLVRCNYYNMEKPWTKLLLAYEQGKSSAGDLLQKAQSIDEKTEANAYVGLEESIKQKTSDAQKHFQWVLTCGNKNFIEYGYVLAEMAWLRSQKSSSAKPL